MRKWLFLMLAGYLWKKFAARGAATSGGVPVSRRQYKP